MKDNFLSDLIDHLQLNYSKSLCLSSLLMERPLDLCTGSYIAKSMHHSTS
ncbi:unnamed protein product [Schistosoma margrebowiei]|uniref:Uncharacterized protein n=1 Tax=Schistosoma margrebowiei TaxID=48269 RepID=A0A3P7Z3W8_9TREM|nr:unnamed protein product [Schistosoma margrebowiei]